MSETVTWQWMRRAYEASAGSNCARRSVGAVVVKNGAELMAGSNGVDRRLRSCLDAGCPRCAAGGVVGLGYEFCICVHAEQDAIAHAARDGVAIGGTAAFVTLRPCLTCLTMMIEAGITHVYYAEDWSFASEMETVYQAIAAQLECFERMPIALEAASEERSNSAERRLQKA
jgi:dCMP deaminase